MSVLFIDNNLGLDHALQLGRETSVYYFSEWRTNFVKADEWMIGMNFERISPGMQRIADYMELFEPEAVDILFIADSGFGRVGDAFRREGGRVFGPSAGSDRLELWREWAAAKMREHGIGTPKYEKVVGYDNLLESVKGRDVYVKVSAFRGSFETLHVTELADLHVGLENSGLGPLRDSIMFLVSEKIEGVEVGIDLWWNGREFLRPYHLGNEVKGMSACFGKWVEESSWDEVLGRMENLLRAEADGFCGEISFEAIYNEEGLYVLDITPRLARPAGSCMYYSLDMPYIDVVEAVADGEEAELRLKNRWSVQIGVSASSSGWSYVCPVEKYTPEISLTARSCVVNGGIWLTPHNPRDETVLYSVACSDSLEDAVKKAYDKASWLAMEGDITLIGGAWTVFREKYIPKLEKYGYEW